MTDPIALQAAPRTIPAPAPTTLDSEPPSQPDTGPYRQEKALTDTYLAVLALKDQVDAIAINLAGRIESLGVDIAQSQSGEVRLSRALLTLSDKLDGIDGKISRSLASLETYANSRLEDNHRIIVLEDKMRRREHQCAQCAIEKTTNVTA
jgi:hypothetical protein